jgi:hypothetical protein
MRTISPNLVIYEEIYKQVFAAYCSSKQVCVPLSEILFGRYPLWISVELPIILINIFRIILVPLNEC